MKKTWVVAIAVVVIALLCGGFYWFNQKYGGNSTEKELTKVQKIITKDLEKDYPETPREVINSIIELLPAIMVKNIRRRSLFS